ncbi:hypothetical protein L9F63_008945 [Diploptera punctata]|uniref:Uncharacterized protein n=1 Tax=Diploptera punctata TaxID=6984 RepID=A0AAD7Z4R5_DIPPU|nr:hypothetical protein L9F63_008945 [Diploptera punctata]
MLRSFINCELEIVALVLEEEDINWRRNRRRRGMWVHNAWKKRGVEGEFVSLLPHVKCDDTKFYEHFRMLMYTLNQLERKLKEKLRKQDTLWRQSVTPRERLAVCLRYVNIHKNKTQDCTILFNYT